MKTERPRFDLASLVLWPRRAVGPSQQFGLQAMAHIPMVLGYALDQTIVGGSALCMTVRGFDAELLRLALLGSPFMHLGMLAGLLCQSRGSEPLQTMIARAALSITAMVAAMAWASHALPGSNIAALLMMMLAMAAADVIIAAAIARKRAATAASGQLRS